MFDLMLICSPWQPVDFWNWVWLSANGLQAVQHTMPLPRAKSYDAGPIALSSY